MLIFLGYKFLELLAFTTPYPVSYFIAAMVARLMYFFGAHVKILKKNVALVLNTNIDDPLVSRTVQKIYINWFCNVADFLKHPLVNIERFNKRIKIDGLENLRMVLKQGKGAVIFTAHVGNFEWGACRIATEGFKVWGTGLRRNYQRTNNFFEKRRLAKGLGTLYANKLMINIFRILKNNEVIAIPTDFDPVGSARNYYFFGKKACIPSGPVEIALKSGAPLLPSFIWREGKYNHHQVIGEPLELDRDEKKFPSRKEYLDTNMGKMIAILEKNITGHLEEWEMFHDIWA